MGLTIPSVPLIFLKPSTAVVGPNESIILPPGCRRVDYEGELAVIVGKKAKGVPVEEAAEYVLGYTCFNDVSDREAQAIDGQWTRAKGYDTFAPIGPWIETDISPDDLKLETYVNGDLRQSASTKELVFSVPELISFISQIMTLLPGDVIATGTPEGVGPLRPGDIVQVKVEGIGVLTNPVVSSQSPA
jgi:2-keto-4-pentenoate hydratase/2-oxohepta-3-ene-1,7-dioic acid hydratase in catechol pathway